MTQILLVTCMSLDYSVLTPNDGTDLGCFWSVKKHSVSSQEHDQGIWDPE